VGTRSGLDQSSTVLCIKQPSTVKSHAGASSKLTPLAGIPDLGFENPCPYKFVLAKDQTVRRATASLFMEYSRSSSNPLGSSCGNVVLVPVAINPQLVPSCWRPDPPPPNIAEHQKEEHAHHNGEPRRKRSVSGTSQKSSNGCREEDRIREGAASASDDLGHMRMNIEEFIPLRFSASAAKVAKTDESRFFRLEGSICPLLVGAGHTQPSSGSPAAFQRVSSALLTCGVMGSIRRAAVGHQKRAVSSIRPSD